jgi:regulator of replication initiation timing
MEETKPNNRNLKIIIGILFLLLVILLTWFLMQKSQLTSLVKEKEIEKADLQKQLDSIITEHNKTKKAYGALSDSLKVKDSLIQANAVEIKNLLGTKYEFLKVSKKLAMLQKIAQGYVQQMDSLYTVNKELQVENEKIREDFRNEQSKTQTLVKDKEALTERVNQAAFLRAYDVVATTWKVKGGDKESPTDKAIRTDRVRVCFTIGENPLVKAGKKVIYICISRPDNAVVTRTKYDTFTYNGQTLPYSIREDFDYQGKAMNRCVNWTKKENDKPAMKGSYTVTVYTEDKQIGTGTFQLK